MKFVLPFFPLAASFFLAVLSHSALARDGAEAELARQILAKAQRPSISLNREYCGTIGIDGSGRIIASPARKGRRDSCLPEDHPEAVEILATYHTHAAFDPYADSEVPSLDDVLGAMEEGTDDYISTPGGRLWHIDGRSGLARQICGIGCLPRDPRFEPEIFGPIKTRYSLKELERRDRMLD